MSSPKFFAYPGYGDAAKQNAHYSQAFRLPAGETIHISGQGGWATESQTGHDISDDIATEIAQAFVNVDVALKNAGGRGMEQVYKLVVYVTPDAAGGHNTQATGEVVGQLREWFPDEEKIPLITLIGVASLAFPPMHIEVDASAYLG
ncbi:endoribonuclease-like protein L-PSP [Xylariaceae sp. FL0016]|nr:endoribonuclease-like protein L-PSP [Xylariaceae sp. FL0016]